MTKEERLLHKCAAEFLSITYNIPLTIPVKRNNRLRTTLGRFVHAHDGTPLRIELAGTVLSFGTKKVIEGILKHECIHYAFHIQGKIATDGDEEFEQELKKHDAPSTRTHRVGQYFIIECKECGKVTETNVKRVGNLPQRYRSACCRATLIVKGERIYSGQTASTE